MVSVFAPYCAEECWAALGHDDTVSWAGWPAVDEALLAEDTVTCVVQVDGKVRERISVSPDITATELESRALAAMPDIQPARVIVRPPKLVNIVLTDR
jgi:leucyl-tRNA synthetase